MPQQFLSDDAPIRVDEFQALLQSVCARDEQAWFRFQAIYQPQLRGEIHRHLGRRSQARIDPEEVAQLVWERAWSCLMAGHQFGSPAQLGGFIHAVTSNVLKNIHRDTIGACKRSVDSEVELDALSPGHGAFTDQHAGPFAEASADDLREHCLHLLPIGDQYLYGCKLAGYTVKQLVARFGRSARTIGRVLKHCTELIRADLFGGSKAAN